MERQLSNFKKLINGSYLDLVDFFRNFKENIKELSVTEIENFNKLSNVIYVYTIGVSSNSDDGREYPVNKYTTFDEIIFIVSNGDKENFIENITFYYSLFRPCNNFDTIYIQRLRNEDQSLYDDYLNCYKHSKDYIMNDKMYDENQ